MGFFPETNYDFPNVLQYDGDLRELLAMYETVKNDYAFIRKSMQDSRNDYIELTQKYNVMLKRYEQLTVDLRSLSQDFKGYKEFANDEFSIIHTDITNLNSSILEFKESLVNMTNNLTQEILAVKTYSDAMNTALKGNIETYVDSELEEIRKEISDLKFKIPNVFNPVQGKETSVQEVIMDYWYYLRDGGYTAQQFDDAGCTAGELDGLWATAIEWDAFGISFIKMILDNREPEETEENENETN